MHGVGQSLHPAPCDRLRRSEPHPPDAAVYDKRGPAVLAGDGSEDRRGRMRLATGIHLRVDEDDGRREGDEQGGGDPKHCVGKRRLRGPLHECCHHLHHNSPCRSNRQLLSYATWLPGHVKHLTLLAETCASWAER